MVQLLVGQFLLISNPEYLLTPYYYMRVVSDTAFLLKGTTPSGERLTVEIEKALLNIVADPQMPSIETLPMKEGTENIIAAIERSFCRLKDFRPIATRYDKLPRNFFSALSLVATLCCWL